MVPTSGDTERYGETRIGTERYGCGQIRRGTEGYGGILVQTRKRLRLTRGIHYRPELTTLINRPVILACITVCDGEPEKNYKYTCVQSSSEAETNTIFLVMQNYAGRLTC